MKRKQVDFTRFLSLFLTIVLLLMAAGGPSWVSIRALSKPVVSAAMKMGNKSANSRQVVIQATTFEAVVTPAISFDFSQAVYLLPPSVVLLIAKTSSLLRVFEVPYFYFSFFRYVFGHHIAINAP